MNITDTQETLSALLRAALAPRCALAAAVVELRGRGVLEETEPPGWLPGESAAILLLQKLEEAGFELTAKVKS